MVLKTLDEHIVITPKVMGGKPRIAGHRISVQDVAIWHNELGYTVDQIANDYNLSLADVYAALAYYYDHKEEIDQSVKEGDEFVEAMRKEIPSKLNQKLLEKINEVYADDELDPEQKDLLEKARKAHGKRIKDTW